MFVKEAEDGILKFLGDNVRKGEPKSRCNISEDCLELVRTSESKNVFIKVYEIFVYNICIVFQFELLTHFSRAIALNKIRLFKL